MLTQRVELGCVGEYRNDGARDVIISTCTTCLRAHNVLRMTFDPTEKSGGTSWHVSNVLGRHRTKTAPTRPCPAAPRRSRCSPQHNTSFVCCCQVYKELPDVLSCGEQRDGRGAAGQGLVGAVFLLPRSLLAVSLPRKHFVAQCSRQRTGSQYKCVQNLLPARAAFFANE